MSEHELRQVIEAADRAIMAEDFEAVMAFYAEDATMVVRPGQSVTGKERIQKTLVAIADHFKRQMTIRQGNMKVIESGNTALVIMESIVDTVDADGVSTSIVGRATHVFRKSGHGKWLCVIDNFYGTALLDA
ncbi:YybH family protein [Bradyrhizobium sp. SYSU BS000235]|uniref:YybH family protein n=1 Tax=Bradyrhizobium sp. SYSU BS000235 TaxID=3411332 RepID=UPI003C78E6C7